MTGKDKNRESRCMTRRIGNTVYKVKVFFSDDGGTMADKMARLIQNGGLENRKKCDIVDLPQMSRQFERSA